MAKKLLGAIGVGFSIGAIVGVAKKFAAENEEIQKAVSEVEAHALWEEGMRERLAVMRAARAI